jgi:cytochrome c-type biogenesis protein CcmF
MYFLGTLVIITGVALALLASVSYFLVTRGNVAALSYARIATRTSLVAVLVVVGMIAYAFVARRYDIKYVFDYSDNTLDSFFRVAAMWAGQPGSFVVWALWGGVATQFLVRRTRHAEPYVLSILMLIQAALLFFMLIRNPFVPYTENGIAVIPTDGKGLNELLHNFWMIIHPPILFVGYALMAVPFAFAIAGLWRRDYDAWVERALPWTLAAWAFLGLALLLGGYWAYETLGWGGYWGWDPVENSALVPWITITALIHSMLIQRTHGAMRRTNFVLAIATYILVFYATFLTRSGVLSSFSVHSFAEEELKEAMIGSLALVTVASLSVLVVRWRDIPRQKLSEKILSRDNFFVLGILVLVVMSVVIGLGTSMPVISSIPGVGHSLQNFFATFFTLDVGNYYDKNAPAFTDGRFGLIGEFYATTIPPLGLILLALMIIGPLLGWRDTNVRHLLLALRWPALFAMLAAVAKLLLVAINGEPVHAQGLGFILLGAFALGTNVMMIARILRTGVLRIGGYLAHVGLALFCAGVVGSTIYATPDQTIVLREGETLSAYDYTFTFNGYQVTPDNKGALDVTVRRGGDVFQATPLLYNNQRMGATMATPAIKSELFQDLYITPAEYNPPKDANLIVLRPEESREIGPYTFRFIEFDATEMHSQSTADVGAKVEVLYEGKTVTLTPKVRVNMTEPDPNKAWENLPETLPGDNMLLVESFDPLERRVWLRVVGLSLPVEPATAVFQVSLKPGVILVWAGVIVLVLGGLIGMVRRSLEGEARLSGSPTRLPQLGRLPRFGRVRTPNPEPGQVAGD